MRNITINFIFLLIGLQCQAGSGPSYLKCKSDSGKTIFYAEIQDIDGGLTIANFKIDNYEIEFDWEDKFSIVTDLENGVYTLTISSKDENDSSQFIKLWGVPSTIKAIENERHKIKYEFKAKISGSDPRPDRKYCPTIELNCTLEWEI